MSAVDDETLPVSGRSASGLRVESEYLSALEALTKARKALSDVVAARATLGDVQRYADRYDDLGRAVTALDDKVSREQRNVRAAEAVVQQQANAWRQWVVRERFDDGIGSRRVNWPEVVPA